RRQREREQCDIRERERDEQSLRLHVRSSPYTVSPPTTVRTMWMSLILSLGTVCGSSASITKSASLPAVIDPLSASSCDAYAPLIVFTAIASSTLMRWFAPHVVPSQPVRVTIPWIPMSGANGPGL